MGLMSRRIITVCGEFVSNVWIQYLQSYPSHIRSRAGEMYHHGRIEQRLGMKLMPPHKVLHIAVFLELLYRSTVPSKC